jgi:zeta-carotene desaturase
LNEADAIVIGGGCAGLAAATALAEEGARVLVIEARRHLGGRATTYRDPATGERIDNGQHVLAGCYDETLQFLRRIGNAQALRRPSTLRVSLAEIDGTRHDLVLPPLPAPFHLMAGVLAWRELSWHERIAILRIGPVLRALARRPDAGAAPETVRRWLERHHQPPRLCNLFWEPLALATLNQTMDDAAAAPFLAVIARMLAGGPDAAALLLPSVLLDELYAVPSQRFLAGHRSRCLTGQPARLMVEDGRVRGVSAGADVFHSTVVIAAVPWFAFGDLFEQAPAPLASTLANAAALGSSPIVTVNLWLDRSIMEQDFLGLPGRTFQWVFDKSRIVGDRLSHLSLVSSGAERVVALDNDTLSRLALDELAGALPEVRSVVVRRASVVRERRATFSLAPSMPARPSTVTPVDGFFLAGDWIDTGLPATIEGAVLSGHRAARAARERMTH